ncbi:hypothetical protein [Caballeronia zhejiangensis]|uniref:hypothetical protein n=1 Tax=Caballeronia zhejiangensis TaxID=871203 RepID=UPI00158CFFB2|nr:hypothetical protein [Caballeronia zhejiangensis]MCG7403050.1 hypothetical protein [Caballeronia zhejiangensis]MCI1043875.1 hypothetical protein [Caballeronia zhejiangensis]
MLNEDAGGDELRDGEKVGIVFNGFEYRDAFVLGHLANQPVDALHDDDAAVKRALHVGVLPWTRVARDVGLREKRILIRDDLSIDCH